MVVMLRSCCCGCTLKTGAIILGILDAIAAIGYLISGIVATSSADLVQGQINTSGVTVLDDGYVETIKNIGIVLCVFAAFLLLASICLITGAVLENPVLLVPWLIYTIIFVIANTVLNIIYAVQYFDLGLAVGGAGNIIGALIYLLLQIYFLLVVYSLYRELKGTAPAGHP